MNPMSKSFKKRMFLKTKKELFFGDLFNKSLKTKKQTIILGWKTCLAWSYKLCKRFKIK